MGPLKVLSRGTIRRSLLIPHPKQYIHRREKHLRPHPHRVTILSIPIPLFTDCRRNNLNPKCPTDSQTKCQPLVTPFLPLRITCQISTPMGPPNHLQPVNDGIHTQTLPDRSRFQFPLYQRIPAGPVSPTQTIRYNSLGPVQQYRHTLCPSSTRFTTCSRSHSGN